MCVCVCVCVHVRACVHVCVHVRVRVRVCERGELPSHCHCLQGRVRELEEQLQDVQEQMATMSLENARVRNVAVAKPPPQVRSYQTSLFAVVCISLSLSLAYWVTGEPPSHFCPHPLDSIRC